MPSGEGMFRSVHVSRRLLLLLAALLLIAFITMRVVHTGKAQRLLDDKTALEAQVQAAYDEEAALKERLAFTATDAFIEQEARRRFGYMAPGEIRFVVDEAQMPPADAVQAAPVSASPPWGAP
jgi:cell division protein FtsB